MGTKKLFNLLLSAILLVWFSGCAGINGGQLAADSADTASSQRTPKTRQNPQFVYVANLGSAAAGHGSISGYVIDGQSGALTPISGSPFLVDDHPGAITAGPLGHHLFVLERKFSLGGQACTRVKGVLLSLAVHQNGALSLADRITLDGSCPAAAVTDGAGKYVYVAMSITGPVQPGQTLGEMQAFAVLPGGKLKEIPGSPLELAPPLQTVAMHPDGKLLFAGTADDRNGVLAIPRDSQTGVLGVPTTAATRPQSRLAIVPPDDLMIADTPSIVDQISVLKIDELTGKLALQFTTAAVLPWGMSLHPAGQFVAIATTRQSPGSPGAILLYRIDAATGSLTQLPAAADAGNGSFDVKFDLSGHFVYATAMNDNAVSGFVFNQQSGVLEPMPGSPVAAGEFPVELTVLRRK